MILWLGWCLFNGGSSMKVTGDQGKIASLSILNTIISGCAAGMVTFVIEKTRFSQNPYIRYNFTAISNGILSGLVSITAVSNNFDPNVSIIIGSVGAIMYTISCKLIDKTNIDDPVDAF